MHFIYRLYFKETKKYDVYNDPYNAWPKRLILRTIILTKAVRNDPDSAKKRFPFKLIYDFIFCYVWPSFMVLTLSYYTATSFINLELIMGSFMIDNI